MWSQKTAKKFVDAFVKGHLETLLNNIRLPDLEDIRAKQSDVTKVKLEIQKRLGGRSASNEVRSEGVPGDAQEPDGILLETRRQGDEAASSDDATDTSGKPAPIRRTKRKRV